MNAADLRSPGPCGNNSGNRGSDGSRPITRCSRKPIPSTRSATFPADRSSAAVASTYTVQQDDYPWKIAAHFTGHGARWPELAERTLVLRDPAGSGQVEGMFSAVVADADA